MSESEVVHLMFGRDNADGTVSVTSVITRCCKVAFPKGLGTLNPQAVTCPAYNSTERGSDDG